LRNELTSPSPSANGTPPSAADGPRVIDLRRPAAQASTRVRIARQDNPYEHLAPDERVKVIIRVLCGLVAYEDEPADDVIDAREPVRAPDVTTTV